MSLASLLGLLHLLSLLANESTRRLWLQCFWHFMFSASSVVKAHHACFACGASERATCVASVFRGVLKRPVLAPNMAAAVDLANKTFVITGGNSGIGLETARALVQKNAHVVIASKTQQRGDGAVQALKREATV